MSRIFLSYAHKDKEKAEEYRRLLERHGHYVWFDQVHMKLGNRIKETLKSNIGSVHFVVFIISKNFMDSEWCTDHELEVAKTEAIEGKVVLIPILIEEIIPRPDGLRNIVCLDAFTPETEALAKQRLIKEVGLPSIFQDPPGFDRNKYFKENLSFFENDDEYTKAKTLLNDFARVHKDDFALLYEERFTKHRNGEKDEEILEVDNTRKYIYRKYYRHQRDIEEDQVSLWFIRLYLGRSDIITWASVIFPLQMALKRVLKEGSPNSFLLFFGIFYAKNEEYFPQEFIEFFEAPENQEIKALINSQLAFRFLQPTAKEQRDFWDEWLKFLE